MKACRWFLPLILAGICSPWASASETPVDPKLIINKGTGYPSCGSSPSAPTCLTGNTIVESFNNGAFSFDFAYTNTFKDLTKLIIMITQVPEGTPFTCQSDIFSTCAIKSPKPDRDDVDGGVEPTELVTVKFTLTGGEIPKFVPGGSPFTFGVDEEAFSATPEPGTWILFATGIIAMALTGFGKKHFGTTPLT